MHPRSMRATIAPFSMWPGSLLQQKKRKRDSVTILTVMTAAGLFLGGLCAAVIGSVKLPLARRLEMDEGRVGVLVAAFSITFLPVVLASGWLIDHFGSKLIFALSLVGIAIGLLALAAVGNFARAIVAVVLFSVAWSALINVVHVMIPQAFPGSVTTGTNLADVFFSLGALLTPLLAAHMVRGDSYRNLLLLLGLFAFLASLPCLLLRLDPGPLIEANPISTWELFSQPHIWLCGLCLGAFGPIETTFATWTSSYLVEKGYSAKFGTRMISVFWGSSLIARLCVAALLPLGGEAPLILLLAIAATFVTGAVVFTKSRAVAPYLVVAAGLACGPLFPTILAILFMGFESSAHGRVVGVTLAISNLGYTLTPILVGFYAKRTSVQQSFLVVALAGVLLIALGVVLNLWL